jgi:hypothetical protein
MVFLRFLQKQIINSRVLENAVRYSTFIGQGLYLNTTSDLPAGTLMALCMMFAG